MKKLLPATVLVYLFGLLVGACSSSVSPVSLGDSIAFINGNVVVTNTTSSDWDDVKLVLNSSYAYTLTQIKVQQVVVIPANEFLNNGRPFDASVDRPWSLKISYKLADGKRGEFVGNWH